MSSPGPSAPLAGPERPAQVDLFVVDDDASLVDSLTDLLSDEGYRVQGFTQPLEALARLKGGARPRAVLLDYVMPEMTGEEFLAALASSGVDVPVLLLSGVADPDIRGAVAGVLPKPFDVDRLLAVLGRLTGAVPG
ncbi:transcriptional regulator [Sorangium cellulosum]|uniref:Transcriptional regulator n=1 Tax=Sorangium cellulosum TaxID=56 RepID=A0A4V0NEQ0_SORCE|nr:response regulator [Sorangium cellulosum]AUX26942.1 transcriptional regulator [Sorangium cellulosum]